MNKTQKGVVALVSGLALLTGTGAAIATTASSASTDTTHIEQARAAGLTDRQAAQLQRSVDAHLDKMKVPAHQVGYNELETDDGSVTITLTAPGTKSDSSCRGGKSLCLWAGDNYDHAKRKFKKCGLYDLSDYGFNDRLTSYKNYQTRGTESRFYNWVNGHRDFLFNSVAKHKEADLQGTGWNNKVDWVKVC